MPLTLGQRRVGVNFNPSQSRQVAAVKGRAADLIDYINACCGEHDNPEIRRAAALAMTHIETASMFAVKALTLPEEVPDGD